MAKKSEPIRVAQIIGKWVGGGVEAVVMNYYRHIDHNKVQFDFICDSDSTDIPYEEIESLGGKVIIVPPYQKVFKYHKELKRVLKEGKYKIVHSHINTLSVFSLYAAKCAGVPVRIAHSHSTTNKKEKKKNLLKQILRPFSRVFATDYMCCTEHAGIWLFGNKTFNSGKVYVLNNAIDLDKYAYNKEIREAKRKELGIDNDTLVIGHIGRFVEQKNHMFLIKLFNEVQITNPNSVLVLVGQGPLMDECKNLVSSYLLNDKVMFLGQRNDANELYQAFDVFCLPSLYEGLGMVAVEAEVSGLYCVVSNEVPKVALICDNIKFLDLNDNIENWSNEIINSKNENRRDYKSEASNFGYNINEEVQKLEDKYLNYVKSSR